MDKTYCDTTIAGYMEKIFGFALCKTMNTEKAEELASRITFDVYVSLLKADYVHNIEGYVYRIARNVYARFVDEETRGRYISLDEAHIPGVEDFTGDFEKNETYIRLRREISYLGKIQREIVVMHYFQKLKQYEIAQRLNIPLGTVKWHLHDARNQIQEGMNKMRKKGTLGMKPVKFISMGHSGNAGPESKDTSYYLSKLISQNVAYSAYHEAKTITEIAEELGVPAAFVEDEAAYLEDNGFMNKTAGGKYLTNILIDEPSEESMKVVEQEHIIYTRYAKIVCEKYIPLVFRAVKNYPAERIYTPENDFNFLMWSAITYACGKKLQAAEENIDLSKYHVKPRDGGDFIAFASLESDTKRKAGFNRDLYSSCGDMTRGNYDKQENRLMQIYAWQLDTYYDDRKGGWQDNLTSDYECLYEFMTGKITKDPVHADKFKRLFDKGYIVSKNDKEYVNMIVTTFSNRYVDDICAYENDFSNLLPAMPDELKTAGKELDAEIFKLEKTLYPPHMQELIRGRCTNCLSNNFIRTHVLEQLAADGTLKPLTAAQKHSVNTILFCDTLPA